MRAQSEKKPSENNGTRRADRMPDQGGRRSENAARARAEKAEQRAEHPPVVSPASKQK